jgi:hypothetical protein
MNKSIEIELSSGTWQISVKDLEQMKGELLELLKQKESVELYRYLIEDLPRDAPMIWPKGTVTPMFLPHGTACIGRWNVIVRDGAALLQRQQMPRAPIMLFNEAPLFIENGQGHVSDVRIVTIHGR